jgi:DNA-binding beta-propeller fold protein YncE
MIGKILVLGLLFGCTAHSSPLKQSGSIELPGKVGARFDYLTVVEEHRYLLSAHLGAGLIYVIDLDSQKLLHTISGLPGIEGIEYVPGLHKAYTSNWGDKTIGVVDLTTMTVIKKLPAENKPDGSVYAAPFGKLYVSDERAKSEIVVDVKTDTILKTLRFTSETGMPQFDSVTKKVYLNLQDENVFAVIDPATDTVIKKVPLSGCESNHGMALDTEHRRAFLACEGNDTLAVFDLDKFTVIETIKLPAGVDVIKFDPASMRLYAACYSGAISVIHEDDPDHFTKLEDFAVQPKVHSLAVDSKHHRLYAPEQEENGKPVSKMMIYDEQ